MKIHIIIFSAVEGYDPPFQPISLKNTLWCTELSSKIQKLLY